MKNPSLFFRTGVLSLTLSLSLSGPAFSLRPQEPAETSYIQAELKAGLEELDLQAEVPISTVRKISEVTTQSYGAFFLFQEKPTVAEVEGFLRHQQEYGIYGLKVRGDPYLGVQVGDKHGVPTNYIFEALYKKRDEVSLPIFIHNHYGASIFPSSSDFYDYYLDLSRAKSAWLLPEREFIYSHRTKRFLEFGVKESQTRRASDEIRLLVWKGGTEYPEEFFVSGTSKGHLSSMRQQLGAGAIRRFYNAFQRPEVTRVEMDDWEGRWARMAKGVTLASVLNEANIVRSPAAVMDESRSKEPLIGNLSPVLITEDFYGGSGSVMRPFSEMDFGEHGFNGQLSIEIRHIQATIKERKPKILGVGIGMRTPYDLWKDYPGIEFVFINKERMTLAEDPEGAAKAFHRFSSLHGAQPVSAEDAQDYLTRFNREVLVHDLNQGFPNGIGEPFDVVFFGTAVMDYLDDKPQAIDWAKSLVRKGGKVFIKGLGGFRIEAMENEEFFGQLPQSEYAYVQDRNVLENEATLIIVHTSNTRISSMLQKIPSLTVFPKYRNPRMFFHVYKPVAGISLSKPIAAGLEESVWVLRVGELEKSDDLNARQLAQEARAAGYSRVVLIPKALSEEADFEDLVVTLFAQESVVTKAMAVLTPEKGLTLRAYPHYIPSQAGRVAEFLREHITDEIQTPVVALDVAFESAVSQILPANHPLTLLLDAEEHHLMPYRKAIATLFTNPPKEGLRNLILKLSRGSVRPVTIGGRDFTAIFA